MACTAALLGSQAHSGLWSLRGGSEEGGTWERSYKCECVEEGRGKKRREQLEGGVTRPLLKVQGG